jgi:hypothetical protein
MPKYVVSSALEEPEWNNSTGNGDEVDALLDLPRRRHAPLTSSKRASSSPSP